VDSLVAGVFPLAFAWRVPSRRGRYLTDEPWENP
jgi:hypothetical protein